MSIAKTSAQQNGDGTGDHSRFKRRISRLLQIRDSINATVATTLDALASRFNVSRRTISRDISTLIECGIAIEYSAAQGGYVAEHSFAKRPVASDGQLIGLLLAIVAAPHRAFPKLATAAADLVSRIVETCRPEQLGALQAVIDSLHFVVDADGETDDDPTVLEQIVAGIAKRRRLRAHFSTAIYGGYDATLLSAPYRLQYADGNWWITARSSLHRTRISFRVDDIHRVEEVDLETPVRSPTSAGGIESSACRKNTEVDDLIRAVTQRHALPGPRRT